MKTYYVHFKMPIRGSAYHFLPKLNDLPSKGYIVISKVNANSLSEAGKIFFSEFNFSTLPEKSLD